MDDSKRKFVLKIAAAIVFIFAMMVMLFIWLKPEQNTGTPIASDASEQFPESFTFYHLGANTALSDAFIQNFEKILGSHAISRKTTLELGIRNNAVLAENFPVLNQLDRKLNGRSNERVEHDTTLLTFRYPPEKTKFFQFAKLWFSNHNAKPLMVDIKTDENGSYLIENIKQKYGPGKYTDMGSDVEALSYWEQKQDYLMVITAPDRFGSDTFSIKIYYVNNLEALYFKEQENQKSPGKNLKNPSEPAFF